MGRRIRLAGLLAVAAAVLAAPAQAATTIGQTFTPSSSCAIYTHLQSASSGSTYAAPQAGVITSWSFQADASPPHLKFKVGRAAGGSNFMIVGESSGPQTPTPNTLNTYPTRISVAAGDVIGFFAATGGGCFRSAALPYAFVYQVGDLAPGTTTAFNLFSGEQLDVSASLEADADNDGFGDETQDQCPTNGTTQGTCPTTGQRAAALKKCKKKHSNKARKKCRKKAKKLPV